jgi:hypothetical protein
MPRWEERKEAEKKKEEAQIHTLYKEKWGKLKNHIKLKLRQRTTASE